MWCVCVWWWGGGGIFLKEKMHVFAILLTYILQLYRVLYSIILNMIIDNQS